MHTSVWVVMALAAVALAGCSEEASPAGPDDTEAAFETLDTQATSDKGVIRGIVVDPAIKPVMDVLISVKGAGLESTTNQDGAFAFSDLDPGTYFLEASKNGFQPVQASATVVAGVDRPPIVKMQMVSDPTTAAFAQGAQWDGFLECSIRPGTGPLGISVGVNACNGVGNQDVNYPHGELGENLMAIQTEMVWESTQASGDELSLVVGPPDCRDVKYSRSDGPTPRMYRLGPDELADPANGWGPVGPEESVCTRVFTYTSGTFMHFYGMQLQQGFTVFTHAFYNFIPDEGWMFVNDGPHPVPQ